MNAERCLTPNPEAEIVLLTREMLSKDNSSDLAVSNRDIFNRRMDKDGPGVYKVRRCSDSRVLVPVTASIDVATVGTGGPKEPYTQMINHSGVRAVVNLEHFDGSVFKPGEKPKLCGAFDTKVEMSGKELGEAEEGDLKRYIKELKSKDQLIQAIYDAVKIARHTDKSVLVAIQDHIRARTLAIATIEERGLIIRKSPELPLEYLLQDQYDPAKFYRYGIPHLEDHQLPEVFQEYMELSRRQYADLHTRYPNLQEMQKKQNPHTAIITTEKMTARGRYPKIFEKPGSYFLIHIPRSKDGSNQPIVTQKTINTALEQIQYPIAHFSNLKNILIETEDIETSVKIARHFFKHKQVTNWSSRESTQILVAESMDGVTFLVRYFNPTSGH